MHNTLHTTQIFQWEGINNKGFRVNGELVGINQAHVHAELKRQGIEALRIQKKLNTLVLFKSKIKNNDIVLIIQQLSTLISAGIPLVQALDIISKGHTKHLVHKILQNIKNDVTSGKTFFDALSLHPKYFSDLFCHLIRVGELSGTLDIMLKRLAGYLERKEFIRKKIRKSMYYPLTVVGISFIMAVILLIFIVPQFDKLFISFGAKLPLFTRIVINLSQNIQNNWHVILAIIFILIGMFHHARKKSDMFHYRVDKTILKLPVIGNLFKKTIIARITRCLATTLSAGIPMLDALNCVAKVANNKVYTQAIFQIMKDVATGQQIHIAMSVTSVFPSMIIQMVAVGEEAGSMDSMLNKIASFYEEEVDGIINALNTLIEPVIILALSIIIGSFVMAMYLPIFKLGSVV